MFDSKLTQTLKKRAEEFFFESRYEDCLKTYSQVLAISQDDKEAVVGAMLADLASDYEDEAQALFDYYHIIKSDGVEEAESMMESFIESFDGSVEQVNDFIQSVTDEKVQYVDGILYQDFKTLIGERGPFQRVFEDLMFSTKIVISGKDDFFEFMNSLVDNGYTEIAMRYIENANDLLANDYRARLLMDKIHKIELLENISTEG